MSLDERVLVVPSAEFDRLGRFQGFSSRADDYLEALFAPGMVTFRPRSEVEDDPSLKQIIPYVIILALDSGTIFSYRRGGSQGEARLRKKRSIGIGGHVAEEDAEGRGTLDAYELALQRELNEEVAVAKPGKMRRVGLINDDSSPVGQVHLGVVHLLEVETAAVEPREDGIAEPEFLTIARLNAEREEFETWSQISIDAFLNDYMKGFPLKD